MPWLTRWDPKDVGCHWVWWRPPPEATTDALWGSCIVPASSSIMGTSWLRPPACLRFPNLSLIPQCDDTAPPFLIAQPQVCFGGIQCLAACVSWAIVQTCLYSTPVSGLCSHCSGKHVHACSYAHAHTHIRYSHPAKAFKKLQR